MGFDPFDNLFPTLALSLSARVVVEPIDDALACSIDECSRSPYIDELCKHHRDMRLHQQGRGAK